MPRRSLLLAWALWTWVFGGSASAQRTTIDSDFTLGYSLKTVPLSFGGAYRALADANAAIVLNPAGIAQRSGVAAISVDYVGGGFRDSRMAGGSIVDYKTTDVLAMGLEYDWSGFTAVANDVTVHHVALAAAKDFRKIVWVGAAAKMYFADVDTPAIRAPDGGDIDLGLLVKPIPMLSLALVGYNLIQGHKYPEFPLELGFGVGLNLPPHARLAIDLTNDFATPASTTVNAYFGGELRFLEGFYLRSGFGLDKVRQNNFYALGLAILGPKLSVNFTFSQRLSPTGETYGGNLEFLF